MKAITPWLGALVCAGCVVSLAQAQPGLPYYPGPQAGPLPCRPPAPDACGPGYFAANPCGALYGPNYYLRPPWCPDLASASLGQRGGYPGCAGMGGVPGMPGAVPGVPPMPGMPGMPNLGGPPGCDQGNGENGIAIFPSHPFARSPRDFFMAD